MPTPPNFKPAAPNEHSPQGTALGAGPPPAAGKVAKYKQRQGGTVRKAKHAAIVEDRKSGRVRAPDGRLLPGKKTTARDALIAMQYKQLHEAAPAILKRLVEGALNQADPFHERCLDLVAKRLMPLAFWEALGKQEFREENEGQKGPVFVINVGAASLPDTTIQTVDIPSREREESE